MHTIESDGSIYHESEARRRSVHCVPEGELNRYNISVFASDISGTGVRRRSRAPGSQSITY